MSDYNLVDQLGSLTADQLATITFEAGVTADDGIPGYGGLTSTGTYWSYAGTSPHTWQDALGTGTADLYPDGITYSFDPSVSSGIFTTGIENSMAQALAIWSDIANINFTYTSDFNSPTLGLAIILAPTGGGTQEQPLLDQPTSTLGLLQTTAASIQLNLDPDLPYGDPSSYTNQGGYGVDALVHESGHLLGLGHTGPYNAGDASDKTDYATDELNEYDVKTWSIMSYVIPTDKTATYYNFFNPSSTNWATQAAETGTSPYYPSVPYTPMGLDIFAAQRLYGAPTNGVLSGGQTFGFNSNIMYTAIDGSQQLLSMYDFAPGYDNEPVVTIYDYGSNNTLDLSGYSTESDIDLIAGTWTSTAGLVDNVFIEYGTQIDTAIGGTGQNNFILNEDGDTIEGGSTGTDSVTLSGAWQDYTPGIAGNAITLTDIATAAVNTLTNIQSVSFSDLTVDTSDLLTVSWTGGSDDGFFNDAGNWYPGTVPVADSNVVIGNNVTVAVTDSESITTLDLGIFVGTGVGLPTVNIFDGTLAVSGDIVSSYTGFYPDPTGDQTIAGGGTIDIDNGGTLQVAGTTAAAIVVDFADANANTLQLGGVNAATPAAFAGTIANFTQGDTIVLTGVAWDQTAADTYDPASHVVTVTQDGVTVATLDVAGLTPLVGGDFVVGSTNGDLSLGEAPPASFIWDVTVAQPDDDWSLAGDWAPLPLTGTTATRTVPRSVDNAYVVGGQDLTVTTAQPVAVLNLGGTIGPGALVPTIDVNAGTLDVTGSLVGAFTEVIVEGIQAASFDGGGTIQLHNAGKLEVGGATDASIAVDFADATNNVLQLDDPNSGAPGAFAGTVTNFGPGDTIDLNRVGVDPSEAATFNAGTLTVTEDGLTVATINLAGTYDNFNFGLSPDSDGGTAITEIPAYAWIPEVSGLSPSSTSWNDPNVWEALPPAAIPVTGVIPGAGDDAFIVGDTDSAIVYFSSPVTVSTLGLGIGSTPDVILPIVDVQRTSLLVTANVLDGWSGVLPGSASSQTFYGGGTIALDYGSSLEVGGSVAAGITVDMRGNFANQLVLDGVSNAATKAFAGMIVDFTQGDTISLPNVHATKATYGAGVLTLLTGGQVDAELQLTGTVGANLIASNILFATVAGSTVITETTTPPPPGTINWTGPLEGDFDAAGNWDLGLVPNSTNNVVIGATGIVEDDDGAPSGSTNNVIDSLQIATGGTLSMLSGSFTVNGVNLASLNQGEIDIGFQSQLNAGGTFNNSGLIQIDGPDAALVTSGDTVTLGGTGTIAMTQGTIGGRNNFTPADTLINLADVIEGSGVIGDTEHPLILDNDGVVYTGDGAGAPLTVAANVVNEGTLESTGLDSLLTITGEVLNIPGQYGGTGVIEAFNGATVQLENTLIGDGTISADATSTIEITGKVTLDGINGVSLSGDVVLDPGASLTLEGTIAGTARIDATQGNLIVLAGAVLSGVPWIAGSNVTIGGGVTIYPYTINSFGQPIETDLGGVSVPAGASVTLAPVPGGYYGNTYNLAPGEVLSVDGKNAFLVIDTIMSIGGGGTIVLGDGGGIAGLPLNNPPGVPPFGSFEPYDELDLNDITITGAGVITGLQLVNPAGNTILANGGTLILDSGPDYVAGYGAASPEQIISQGVLGATAGSDLVIMGSLDLLSAGYGYPGGALTGGGTITLGGSSAATGAQSGTMVGGTVTAGMVLQVVAPGGGLDAVTIAPTAGVVVNAGALLTLSNYQGSLVNNGEIALNGSSVSGVHVGASLAAAGDVTLTGTGTIEMFNGGDPNSATEDSIVSVTNAGTLENDGNTIAGYGFLGGSYLNLDNFGTVDADVLAKNLSLAGGSLNSVAGVIENGGLMEASNGGTLVVDSPILNYGLVFEPGVQVITAGVTTYGAYEPSGGGDVAAIGTHSAVALSTGTITAGILMTADGGTIYVTGDASLSGGADPALPLTGPAKFGGPDVIVNTVTAGRQSNGATAGLIDNQGRIAVAWVDSGSGTPVVRYQVLDQFGIKYFAGDMALPAAAAGASQTDPAVAALSNGGFVITWLETGGGATTLRAATFNADLSVANSGIAQTLPSGASVQEVAGLQGGGFVIVWSDATAAGVPSTIHVQTFSAAGLPGSIVSLAAGLTPDIAVATDGSGAYAVTWATSAGAADVQFFTATGVSTGPTVVPASFLGSVPSAVTPGTAPFIAAADGGFIVFWNDPVNGPQGQGYSSNGTQFPVNLPDYLSSFTAGTAVLPDGRIATTQNVPEINNPSSTDVGVQFGAPIPVYYGLVSYADVVVKTGNTLTLTEGMYNDGLIALSAAGNAVLATSGYVTVDGPGTISLGGTSDAIVGPTGADQFINAGNTIEGEGWIGAANASADNLSFDNQGVVDATGGDPGAGTLSVETGTGTLANVGLMEATTSSVDVGGVAETTTGSLVIHGTIINGGTIEAAGGTVTVLGPVVAAGTVLGVPEHFNDGYLAIFGGEMVLTGSVDARENIFFATSTTTPATLVLEDPSQMDGAIIDLNVGDTIDVAGVLATSANFNAEESTLTLMLGTAPVAAFNLYTAAPDAVITLAPDGKGGTLIEMVPSSVLGLGASPVGVQLPGGGFFTVYQPTSGGFETLGVEARIYNAAKQPVGLPFTLDANGVQPSIAGYSSTGQFIVVWADNESNTIEGQLFDDTGTALTGTLILASTPGIDSEILTNPVVTIIQGNTPTGYGVAYSTEDFSGGNDVKSITYLSLDLNGQPDPDLTSAVFTSSSVTINGLSYPISAPQDPRIIAELSSSSAGETILTAMSMTNPVGFGQLIVLNLEQIVSTVLQALDSGSRSSLSGAFSITTNDSTQQTVLITPADDGMTHVSPEIAALSNGDVVVVWDEIAPADLTWTVAGQIITQTGQFAGSRFTIATALPAASTPDRPAISALPNGDFVVTYDDGTGSLAGQEFDASGNPLGSPFGVSNDSQGDPSTIVLSDGSLLSLSGDSDGSVNGETFSEQGAGATWSGATGTDLGTAGNWQPVAVPTAAETLTFNLQAGSTLTGTVSGMNAVFSGAGAWLLQGAALTLAGEQVAPGAVLALTEDGDLTVSGGTIGATGSLDIETGTGASMTVLGGAKIGAQGMSMGLAGGQSGYLTVSGTGTAIQNTGTSGQLLIGGGGAGQVSVANGASLSAIAAGSLPAAALGVSAGGSGTLSVTGTGSHVTLSGQLNVGEGGSGSLTIGAQGTVQTGNDPALDPAEGFDIAQLAGGSGQATVTGANSLLTNSGRFVVGDQGLGSLSIEAGATVITAPGASSSLPGLAIANTAGADGSSVNLTGAGSNLQVTGLLDVGVAGSGALSISGGATVTAGSLDAGNVADAVANINVSDATFTVTGSATVADDGTGVMSVLSGATFSAANLTIGSQGDSSGALVVSGEGSVVNISGDLNVGTAFGTGDLTIGPGAVVNALVVSLQGQVVLENGELDPTVNLINQGQTAGGSGTIAAGDIVDEGVIQAGGSKPSQKLLVVAGTVLGGGPWTINSVSQFQANGNAGILQINAGGTMELTGPVLNAASTTFTDDVTPQSTYTVNDSVVDVNFADATGVLKLDSIGGFAGTIVSFRKGDEFVITGGTLSNLGAINGNTLTVSDSGHGGTDQLIFASSVSAAGFSIVNNNTIQVACFAAGTRIATSSGPVAVEALRVGDRVTTNDGMHEPVVWIGQRSVNCERHPKPETVWPIRVARGAFGANVPARDLYLSPDHAVFMNGALIPVKLLINGTNIAQVKRGQVTYFHVELPEHAVILAEGLAVESYLDLGDRADFGDADGTIRLFPDFTARLAPDTAEMWETRGAAPLVMTGEKLCSARAAVAAGERVTTIKCANLNGRRAGLING